MLESMTGYGSKEKTYENWSCQCVIKSLNSRYLDLSVFLPPELEKDELFISKLVKKELLRGKISLSLYLSHKDKASAHREVNSSIFEYYFLELTNLSKQKGLDLGFSATDIFQLPDVLQHVDYPMPENIYKDLVLPTLQDAISELRIVRKLEGRHLEQDISSQIQCFKDELKKIEDQLPRLIEEYQDRMTYRIELLCGEVPFDENRVLQEVAIYAEKSDINEEIVRTYSHLNILDTLTKEENVKLKGKKMDFYLQELQREVNTMGSKIKDAGITRSIVELKHRIEIMREQVQNIL